jgi:hypothetical protein
MSNNIGPTGEAFMRAMTIGLVAIATAILMETTVSTAYAQSCFDLWVQRNSIYKRAGYCFKTSRAIRYFGNGGCSYDYEGDLPLSSGERAQIARILGMERRMGCR